MDYFSTASMHVEPKPQVGDFSFGNGTAFCVEYRDAFFLVTARHVLVGDEHAHRLITRFECGTPGRLVVHVPVRVEGQVEYWRELDIPLYDEHGIPLWQECHHETGEPWDLAALPMKPEMIPDASGIRIDTVDFGLSDTDLAVAPGESVNIIGFPWGESAGTPGSRLAIWKTGYVASEFREDYFGWPAFLVDATTTGGMSGSPVYAVRRSDFRLERGFGVRPLRDGTVRRFLGVYAGKIRRPDPKIRGASKDLSINVGVVWRFDALARVLEASRKQPDDGSSHVSAQ